MQLYLKEHIQFAPYIWNWYAWSHLIAPHTAAANIADRHIKIMDSFINYPELHFEAIHSRGMIGGPFINLAIDAKDHIVDLLNTTKKKCEGLLQLNNDIKQFSLFLNETAEGMAMESLYHQLPTTLKGRVELVYDLHNKPQIRFIEPLLYAKYYDDRNQCICLAETVDDKRSFSLSTPYVEKKDTLSLTIPFSSPLIDRLAKMKVEKNSFDNIISECNIPLDKMDLFRSFFTENPPMIRHSFDEPGVNIKYFGHACVLVQTAAVSILVDPALGYQPDLTVNDRFTAADLPDVLDYVLITHNHQDHFLLETLLQLRHRIKTIVVPSANNGMFADPSLKLILKHLGFNHVIAMDEFDEIHLANDGRIAALPFYGEHGDLNIQTKCSYFIELDGKRFVFLADSNNMDNDLYQHIVDLYGTVDVMFIGMECVGAPASWLYGPLFPKPLSRPMDQSRRLSGSNATKAWQIVKTFSPKEVYVYAMGMEPWLGYIMAIHYKDTSPPIIESNQLIATCLQEKIYSKRLFGKEEWHYKKENPSCNTDYLVKRA